MRAPTPTGAAELAVPNQTDVLKHIEQLRIRANENIYKKINYQKLYLDSLKNSFVIKSPMIMYENKKQKLDMNLEKIKNLINNILEVRKNKFNLLKSNYLLNNPNEIYKHQQIRLENIIDKLNIINPLNTLKRGYTLTYFDDNIVKDIKDIKVGNVIKTRFTNGTVESTVTNIKEVKDGNN